MCKIRKEDFFLSLAFFVPHPTRKQKKNFSFLYSEIPKISENQSKTVAGRNEWTKNGSRQTKRKTFLIQSIAVSAPEIEN